MLRSFIKRDDVSHGQCQAVFAKYTIIQQMAQLRMLADALVKLSSDILLQVSSVRNLHRS